MSVLMLWLLLWLLLWSLLWSLLVLVLVSVTGELQSVSVSVLMFELQLCSESLTIRAIGDDGDEAGVVVVVAVDCLAVVVDLVVDKDKGADETSEFM